MILFAFVFVAALLVTAYYIFALMYHWIKYSATLPLVWAAMPVYFIGTGFFLLLSLAALVAVLA